MAVCDNECCNARSSSDEEDADDDVTASISASTKTLGAVEGPARIGRLMKRDMPMYQSWGNFSIRKKGVSSRLLWSDVFHMILRRRSWQLILGCFTLYTLFWLLFAVWWLQIAEPCGISLETYRQALYLSIETMMTIGYGVDDPFFQNCTEALPVLFIQSFVSMLLDIAIVGILFQRFSRAYRRAATIIFSKTALLRQRGPRIQLAFRIAEMQESPLLQVALQAYVVMHRQNLLVENESEENTDWSDDLESVMMKALHLQELDVTNNVLLCGLPMTVSHIIDRFSPLAPCNWPHSTHMRDPTLPELEAHLNAVPYIEILVVLSGVEESTGASVEGRQSYTLQDLQSGCEFCRCVYLDPHGKHCTDFNLFHRTRPGVMQVLSEADAGMRQQPIRHDQP